MKALFWWLLQASVVVGLAILFGNGLEEHFLVLLEDQDKAEACRRIYMKVILTVLLLGWLLRRDKKR